MKVLLRAAAVVSLAWGIALLGLKERILEAAQLTPVAAALANGLGSAHLAFAFAFWHAARDPRTYRGVIYAAIMLQALKMANDVHQMLVLLPPNEAMVSLADLVVSIGLLVGLLEALPRTLAAPE